MFPTVIQNRPATHNWPGMFPPTCPAVRDDAPEALRADRDKLRAKCNEVATARAHAEELYAAVRDAQGDPDFDRRPYFKAVIEACRLEVEFREGMAVSIHAEGVLADQAKRRANDAVREVEEGARRKLRLPEGAAVPIPFLQSIPAWWIARREAAEHHGSDNHAIRQQDQIVAEAQQMAEKYQALIQAEQRRLDERARPAASPPCGLSDMEKSTAQRNARFAERSGAASRLLAGATEAVE